MGRIGSETDTRRVVQAGAILIVEDNSAVSAALHAYFTRVEGWPTVLTAGDAETGLTLAVEHQPVAIVLDNRMPGGSGVDVLSELRRACPDAVIVMHTTEDTIDLRDEAERRGADAIVTKGRPLSELAALVRAS
jgi:DNA-binding NarL/FixJ family response regulator